MQGYKDYVCIHESFTIPSYEKPGKYSLEMPLGRLNNGRWKWHIQFTIESIENGIVTGKVHGWVQDAKITTSKRIIYWGGYVICPEFSRATQSGTLKEEKRFLLTPYQWCTFKYRAAFPCDQKFTYKLSASEEEFLPKEAAGGISALAQSLGSLLTSGLLSDVTLRTKEGDVAAHRNILAARSDFFKTKFKPEWQEGDAVVDVSDVPLTVLKEMLKYMYSGSYGDNVSMIDLLVAADMYLVTDLCNEIKEKLEKNLESGNQIAPICDLLKTSAICNSTSLRAVVLKYMKKHPEVWKTKEWKEFHIANRQVAAEAALDMINLSD